MPLNDIFSTSKNPPLPAAVESPSEAPKSVDEVTAQVANQYLATGDIAQPKQRKPRSDIGKPRVKRGVDGSPLPAQTPVSPDAGQSAGYTVDKAIVEKTALTVLHAVDHHVVRRVGQTVFKLSGDKELAAEMASNAGLTKEEAGLMSELSGVIFEKRGWLTGYAPEILLAVLFTEWGLRVTLVLRRLDQLEKDAKAAKNAHKPSAN